MAEEGTFRKDLLFRLRALEMELPALRKRKEDIAELARDHLARLCDLYGVGSKGFCPDFQEALTCYDWPGNVRERIRHGNRWREGLSRPCAISANLLKEIT